jgi:hypothetical protein
MTQAASASEYRRKAEELRARASSTSDEISRSAYLAAAESWDLLATAADQRSKEVMLRVLREARDDAR